MGLAGGIKRLYQSFNKGVSYKSGDIGDKLVDAQNMIIIQNKLQTRPGLKKFTPEALTEATQSLSFYKKDDGTTRKVIAKTGTTLKVASPEDGVFTTLQSGLSTSNIHDGLTMLGRHLVAIGSDGLFSYNGTVFAELGIDAPGAPARTIDAGGTIDETSQYVVAITFVCESTGFETNIGTATGTCTPSLGNQTIGLNTIPVSTHGLVTHKNIYLKNITLDGQYLYVDQIANATTTYSITANPDAASANPPTGKDPPLDGGGKYLAIYNSQLISAGNSNFLSDMFFSNVDEPDGWDTENRLVHVHGDGPITGIAVGYYSGGADLNQYLVGFKKRSLTVYFQSIYDEQDDQQIDISGVGCVSHKTIKVKDGNIYFLSDYGWRVISDGKLLEKTLGDGDIDDIFRIAGFTYGLNKQQLANSFATYYSELDSYMCWVPEGSSESFNKCYNWHMDVKQWMPMLMGNSTCAMTGEDDNGEETVYIGNNDRNIYKYSIRNEFSDDVTTQGFVLDIDQLDIDELQEESASSIPIFSIFNWQPNEDFSSSYNFRDLTIEALGGTSSALSTVTVKAFLNFSRSNVYEYIYDFYNAEGFILDVSMLDVGILGDERARRRITSDINRSANNIMIGIYQNVIEARLQLLAYQLNFSKNGNNN